MDNIINNQLIQLYTVGILKDEINELRKLYLELKQEMNEIIKFMNMMHTQILNDNLQKKMNDLNI